MNECRRSRGLKPTAKSEGYARKTLGHTIQAVRRAYSKNAGVTLPSLGDCEQDWQKPRKMLRYHKIELALTAAEVTIIRKARFGTVGKVVVGRNEQL